MITGYLKIVPDNSPFSTRVSWKIEAGVNTDRCKLSPPDATIYCDSGVGYITEAAAKAAGKVWAKRLGIQLFETQVVCTYCGNVVEPKCKCA